MITNRDKNTYKCKDRSTARIEIKMDLEMTIIRIFMEAILIKEEARATTGVRVRVRDRVRDRDRDRDRVPDRDRIGVKGRVKVRDRFGVRDRDRGF